MKLVKLLFISFLFSCVSISTVAQEMNSTDKKLSFEFNGYLKFMETMAFSNSSKVLVDNLVHNRLNFALYTPKGSKFVAQFRNRIFFGASVKNIPNYGDLVNEYDGVLPLEWLLVNNENLVINTIVDRLYYEYSNEKMQIRVGRQRINWGINTTWNPNDLFNSYNIYDFDYEEREGSDAVSVSIFPNYMSSVDFAYKFTGNWDTDVVAFKYKFNKWNYDFQLLGGKFEEFITIGTGWAGSIGMTGFKGEITYFDSYISQKNSEVSFSTSFDYSLSNGTYVLGTYLLNTSGKNYLIDPSIPVLEIPNAMNLMPAKHSSMLQLAYPISPVFNASLGTIYGFGINSLTIFPTLTIGLKTNLDFDLIGQFFWQELPSESFQNIGNGIFWRLKYSF